MIHPRNHRFRACTFAVVMAVATVLIAVRCSRVRVGDELPLTCPPGEISCESDQRVMLYPTSESITGAWDLRKRYTLSACRTWMNEAVRCRILPVGTMIKVEGIEVKEGLDILRVKTMDDGRGWYLEPKFVGE